MIMDARLLSFAALDRRIEREILRLRVRYELSLDEFRGLYISDDQVDRLLADSPRSALDVRCAVERPSEGWRDSHERWRALAEGFALTPLEEDLLALAAGPEFDPKYETLYAYLNDDVTRKWPTVDLGRRLLADVGEHAEISAALSAGRRLRACHLVQPIEPPSGRPSVLNTGFALQPCVTHWLFGHSMAATFDGVSVRWIAPEGIAVDTIARRRAVPLERLLAARLAGSGELPAIVLHGDSGSGRTATAAAAAAASRRPLVLLDFRTPCELDSQVAATLDALSVALTLLPAVVLLDAADLQTDDEAHRARSDGRLARAIQGWAPTTLVLIRATEDGSWRHTLGRRRIVELRCHEDVATGSFDAWKGAAAAESLPLCHADLQGLAGRFTLTPGHVRAAFATARDLAVMSGQAGASADHVATAARLASGRALDRLAVKVEGKHEWCDLVLPPQTLRRLQELCAAIQHRHLVFGEWGFGTRIAQGSGIRALFAGASGYRQDDGRRRDRARSRARSLQDRSLGRRQQVHRRDREEPRSDLRAPRAAQTRSSSSTRPMPSSASAARSRTRTTATPTSRSPTCCRSMEEHDGVVILATNLQAQHRRRVQPADAVRDRVPAARRGASASAYGAACSRRRARWRRTSISPSSRGSSRSRAATSATSRSTRRSSRRRTAAPSTCAHRRRARAAARQAGKDADRHRVPPVPAAAARRGRPAPWALTPRAAVRRTDPAARRGTAGARHPDRTRRTHRNSRFSTRPGTGRSAGPPA